MNIEKIMVKQIALNEAIMKNHNIKNEDCKEKQILALIVEISELANEIQHFKYWKKGIVIDQEKILEEYSDGIHFYLSFGLDFKISNIVNEHIFSDDITLQFLEIYNSIFVFFKEWNIDNFNYSLSLFIGLGKLLIFSDEDITDAYLRKNKINFNRIKNKY
ncbi:MAG: dUTP diphosphatase [Mycoplasmataceae bacterium]|nr:dUTP diphosphatase [Mycoplasmataceae bacterium]